MKRNPNYEIEENQNPNPKKILLWNRRKLQATFIYLSTTSKSMKCIIELSQVWGKTKWEGKGQATRIWT
jgi:hypothetical protein